MTSRHVSTHSRPKAAGISPASAAGCWRFQHTAARRRLGRDCRPVHPEQSFNTQPPEGGWDETQLSRYDARSFNTQPPEGGWFNKLATIWSSHLFQHTAARRRLGVTQFSQRSQACFNTQPPEGGWFRRSLQPRYQSRFNTQPPEGGWWVVLVELADFFLFQHTAARRRLADTPQPGDVVVWFQHTAARRRLGGLRLGNHAEKWFQHTAARRRLGIDCPNSLP